MIDRLLNRRPAVGLAVGVVGPGGLELFHAHGVADIASQAPVRQDTVFRVASITKTFTAIAVMQLWEQGLVDLDAPANDYLRAVSLEPAQRSDRPATVRHLLTHTAGLPEVLHPLGALRPDFGESVPVGQQLPSLAEFYGGRVRVRAEPGTRFVYTNHGPAILGQLVEDVTATPLDRYIDDHVFGPLGMTGSTLVRSGPVRKRLATGYEIGSRGVTAVSERDMVTVGAAAAYSPPTDMARYLAALLGGGRNHQAAVLAPGTIATMFAPQYQPDPRIPGMGLGFFRTDLGGHVAVGHQGTHPGFHSQILAAPGAGVGVMAFTNGANQADLWLPSVCAGLLRRLLGIADATVRSDVPLRPDLWSDLCGWYRLSARLSDVRVRGMMGAGLEVFVRGGRLMLRFLTPIPALARGFALHPDDVADPRVFRIDLADAGLDPVRVVFGQDGAGRVARVHLDLMPLTLDKQTAATNPRRWVAATLGAVGAASGAAAVRRRRSD